MARVYVDPGVKGCGLALFEGQNLVWACYVSRTRRPKHRLAGPDRNDLIDLTTGFEIDGGLVEHMRIRPEALRKGDQNDLVDVAFIAGGLAFLWGLHPVKPETWKGQVPKGIMVNRIMCRLTEDEAESVTWPSKGSPSKGLNHNVADAVGIGLWDNRRLPS